jgi:hypothetical protein
VSAAALIPLRDRAGIAKAWATVDADDYARVNALRWHLFDGYARRNVVVKGRWRALFMHRFVMGLEFDNQLQPDHENRDRLDNRKSNLILVPRAAQAQNITMRRDNTSGFRGVTFHKATGKWAAHARLNRKRVHLGLWETREDAAAAAAAWRREHMPHSEEARMAA